MFEKHLSNYELSELLSELAAIHDKPQNRHVQIILIEAAERLKAMDNIIDDGR